MNPDKDWAMYCAICWQEFDEPKQHNTGSIVNTSVGPQRLDGFCKGDLREKDETWQRRAKREAGPRLDLDAAPPPSYLSEAA